MPNLTIRLTKETQASELKKIANSNGVTRNKLLREIVIKLSNDLPERKYEPEETIQVKITGLSQKTIDKIKNYTNSIGSSTSEEMKREVAYFINKDK